MPFLFTLFSVAFTVVSSQSVSVSGELPEGSQAFYARSGTTGQKGQMTAGNSTTLELTGWDACIIDSVVLNMRSNTASGAGSMRMLIGERQVWHIADNDFSDATWNGTFSTQWVDIVGHIGKRVGQNDTITIHIEASKNSLYINRYTIYYSLPEPQAYEVRFISGLNECPNTITEEYIGSGVLLPQWNDTLDWHFLGWSETEVLHDTICPIIWRPGEHYYPRCDCKLWAVYSDGKGSNTANEAESGDYVIATAIWSVALKGGVEQEEVRTTPVIIDTTANGTHLLLTGAQDEMKYHFDFKSDSTVMIGNIASMSAIGHSGSKLADRDTPWLYRVLNDGSYCFYYNDKAHQRMLYVGYGMNGDNEQLVAYAIRSNVAAMTRNGFWLFRAEQNHFTTWPFGKLDDIQEVYAPNTPVVQGEYRMFFGNIEMRIKNGKKALFLRP